MKLFYAEITGYDKSAPLERLSGKALGYFKSDQEFESELKIPDEFFLVDQISLIDEISADMAKKRIDDPCDVENFEEWFQGGAPDVIIFWR